MTNKNIDVGETSYGYFNCKDSNWRVEAVNFINDHKPDPGTVSGGFSGSYDLHIFVKRGTFKGIYSLTTYNVTSTKDWEQVTMNLINAGTARVLGLSDNDVWILNWK